MLWFGNIAATGGIGTNELWQLNAPAPADVELNTGNGADGINATLPAAPQLHLLLTDKETNLFGFSAAGGFFDSTDFTAIHALLYNGVTPQSGAYMLNNNTGESALFLAFPGEVDINANSPTDSAFASFTPAQIIAGVRDRATNALSQIIFVNNFLQVVVSDTAGAFAELAIQSNSVRLLLNNGANDFGGELSVDANGATGKYLDAMANVIATYFIGAAGFRITQGGLTNLFGVSTIGEILTNQTAPSVAVRAKVAEMPIFDMAGALIGYIDVNL